MTFYKEYDIIIIEKRKDGTYQMKRGQIYYADLSPAKGSEQGGLRPVLIVQNDVGNKHSPTTIIAPLTTQIKHKLPTHFDVQMPNGKKSTVLMEQLRVIENQEFKVSPLGSCGIGKMPIEQ